MRELDSVVLCLCPGRLLVLVVLAVLPAARVLRSRPPGWIRAIAGTSSEFQRLDG